MIYSDILRQLLLGGTGVIFCLFVCWSLYSPASLARTLGYQLDSPNGHSELGAIYSGVFLAQALLCGLALLRVNDAVLGDLVAVFLLLQPVGRLLPLIKHGAPTGLLRWLLIAEVLGGAVLLAVRPGVA